MIGEPTLIRPRGHAATTLTAPPATRPTPRHGRPAPAPAPGLSADDDTLTA